MKRLFKYTLICLYLVCLCQLNSATENKYKYSDIPDSLLKNASSVVRNDLMDVIYIDNNQYNQKQVFAITVLNKSDDKSAEITLRYSKLLKLNNYKAFIYDADGEMIRKIKPSDFTDISNSDGYALFSDDRCVYYKPSINKYPYTIEYVFDYTSFNLLNPVNWFFQSGYDKSVQYSSLKITIPNEFKSKYKTHLIDSMQISNDVKTQTLFWEMSNLKALEYEPYSEFYETFTPWIKFAVSDFEIEGYQGSVANWDSLSNFFYRLSLNNNILSEKTKSDIKQICDSTKTFKDKVCKIYEYMQSRTRYVSIQLGIGGYKPFDASVVDKLGYGDCKALVNYMQTLLKEANISSIYTLVRAGNDASPIDTSFVYNQFNHVILCVPTGKDTIWLECTNQKIPFNYLGDFTGNRLALLVMEEGGKLVNTQRYNADKNLQSRIAKIIITDSVSQASSETHYYGMQFVNRFYVSFENKEKQKRWLYDRISIPNYVIQDVSFECKKSNEPEMLENLTLKLNNYTLKSGKRIFLPLNILNRSEYLPPTSKPRERDIYLSYSFFDCDTIVYQIAEGLRPEALPEEKVIKSDFGEYYSSVTFNNQNITYIRKYKVLEGHHQKSKYNELVSFKKQINLADNIKISLIKE